MMIFQPPANLPVSFHLIITMMIIYHRIPTVMILHKLIGTIVEDKNDKKKNEINH